MVVHPVFKQKIKDLKLSFLAKIANSFLSLGGLGYYLNDKDYSTRIVLFNYCSLLANEDFESEWTIELFSATGQSIFFKKGIFKKQELVVFDLKDIELKSEYGLVIVHIKPLSGAKILGKVYDTVFFTEHYHRNGKYNDIAHSLRWLTPLKHYYEAVGHGFSVLKEARPFLFVANSCDRIFDFPRFYSQPKIELVNHKNEVLSALIPPIRTRGCAKIDLLELIPNLHDHMRDLPGLIKVSGLNIARRPFFYQTNGQFLSSDHL